MQRLGLKSKVQENFILDGMLIGVLNDVDFFWGNAYPFLTSSTEWIDFNLCKVSTMSLVIGLYSGCNFSTAELFWFYNTKLALYLVSSIIGIIGFSTGSCFIFFPIAGSLSFVTGYSIIPEKMSSFFAIFFFANINYIY